MKDYSSSGGSLGCLRITAPWKYIVECLSGEFTKSVQPWDSLAKTKEDIFYNMKVFVDQSCLILYDPMDCSLPASSVHRDSPDKNTTVGSHSLLQGIFLTQGANLVSRIAGRFFTI